MAHWFANLIFTGKVKDAIHLLFENENGGVLSLDSRVEGRPVKDILIDKHPPSKPPTPLALFSNLFLLFSILLYLTQLPLT